MKTKRVLLIDDEPGITSTMKVNLERSGAWNASMIAGHFFIAKPASVESLTRCIEECTRA